MKLQILLVVAYAAVTQMSAQAVLSTTGGSYASSTVSVNWTVGETMIQTFDTNNVLVTQGLQQQSDFTSNVVEVPATTLTLWPNPARESVTISDSKSPIERIEIFDAVGKLVVTYAQKNTFSVAPLAAGSYVVRVHSNARSEEHRLVVVD